METGYKTGDVDVLSNKNGDVLSNKKGFVHCAKGKGEGFSEAGIN